MDIFKISADISSFKTLRELKRKIQSNAPYMDRGGYKQSRRIRGHIELDREIRCYDQVFLYIQKGLGWAADDLKQVIEMIYSIQNREWDIKFPLYLAVFGNTGLTAAEKPFKNYSFKSDVIRTIEQLVGNEKVPSTIILNQLDLNINTPVKINRNDLVLIVLDSIERLSFSFDAKNTLLKNNHTYVIWKNKEAFIGGEFLNNFAQVQGGLHESTSK